MIGIKYLKYCPESVFKLPTGLTIYKSPFVSPDGTRGVVGGPHHVFSLIEKYCCSAGVSMSSYLTQQLRLVELGYQVNADVHLLGQEMTKDTISNQDSDTILSTTDFTDGNQDIYPQFIVLDK